MSLIESGRKFLRERRLYTKTSCIVPLKTTHPEEVAKNLKRAIRSVDIYFGPDHTSIWENPDVVHAILSITDNSTGNTARTVRVLVHEGVNLAEMQDSIFFKLPPSEHLIIRAIEDTQRLMPCVLIDFAPTVAAFSHAWEHATPMQAQ